MARIIDCSIGFNEVDLFEIRAAELRDVVNTFVIVEATKTHSGAPKPAMFSSIVDHLLNDRMAIVHHIIKDMPDIYIDNSSNRFILEMFQRNCIMRGLSDTNVSDEDIILISDVDEIPRASTVKELPHLMKDAQIVIFQQTMLRYFANNASELYHNKWPWLGTVACRYGLLKRILPQTARIGDQVSPRAACVCWGYDRELYPYERRVYDAGWHLTSMGGLEACSEKLSAVSEGLESPKAAYLEPPRGRHNFRDFRDENAHILDNFRNQFCPKLDQISLSNPESIASLDIPRYLVSNAKKLNHLFYLSECIE